MERVAEDTRSEVEVFKNDIEMYLALFMEQYVISDMTTESQNRWNACLMYIYENNFKGTTKLRDNTPSPNSMNNNVKGLNKSTCNRYSISVLECILDIYKYICSLYDKEVSIMGFSYLTGVEYETLRRWGSDPSYAGYAFVKRLYSSQEESLSSKLISGKNNPVGTIAVLNRKFGWASPYTSDSARQARNASGDDIRALISDKNDSTTKQLTDNNGII